MTETVSVIVPCYNQAQFLHESLESVLNQTYPYWECIIVDDGSPDNTEEIALEWCKKDERFRYLKKTNGGLSSARNVGIAATTGSYILPLDADDRIEKDYLELGVEMLNLNKDVKVVYGEAEYFGAREGMWDLPDFSLRSLALKNIIYCSAIFRRQDFIKFGPYDESFKHGREDWDLWLSMLQGGGIAEKLDSVVFFYRKHELESMIDNMKRPEIDRETKMKIFLKHHQLYFSLFGDPITAFSEWERNEKALERLKDSKFYRLSNFIHRKFHR